MSLYLGENALGGKLMHITKNSYDTNEMKDGVLADTVFHSDLPYVTYSVYSAIEYVDYSLNGWYSSTSVKFPISCVQDILSGITTKVYFVVVDGVVFNGCDFFTAEIPYESNIPVGVTIGTWYASHGYAGGTQVYYDDYSYTPKITHLYKKIQRAGKRNVKIVVLNIADDGQYTPPTFTDTDIKIGGGKILVKGIDLINYRYISDGIINSTDDTITNGSGGVFQLVNSIVGSSLDIVSNTAGSTIAVDGKVLFDSNNSSRLKYDISSYFYAAYKTSPSTSPAPVFAELTSIDIRTYYRMSDLTFYEGENFILQIGQGTIGGYYSHSLFGSGLLTFKDRQLMFTIAYGNTAAATVTAWKVYGYNGMLCMTSEIVYVGNPPVYTGPIDISSIVIKLK